MLKNLTLLTPSRDIWWQTVIKQLSVISGNMGKQTSENSISNEKDIKTKKPSVKEVISNFCGYTTAHGLGRLADGGGIFRRVSWTLFCVGAMVMFIVQTKNLCYLPQPTCDNCGYCQPRKCKQEDDYFLIIGNASHTAVILLIQPVMI